MFAFDDAKEVAIHYLLPGVGGILIGLAGDSFRLKCTHDSVLRRAFLDGEEHASRIRSGFAAMVNGKQPLCSMQGKNQSAIGRIVYFYALVGVLMAALALPYDLAANQWPELWTGLGEGSEIRVIVAVVALPIWVFCVLRLRLGQHRAYLCLPLDSFPAKHMAAAREFVKGRRRRTKDTATKIGEEEVWVSLTASRADDGLPTRTIEYDPLERTPLPIWRDLF